MKFFKIKLNLMLIILMFGLSWSSQLKPDSKSSDILSDSAETNDPYNFYSVYEENLDQLDKYAPSWRRDKKIFYSSNWKPIGHFGGNALPLAIVRSNKQSKSILPPRTPFMPIKIDGNFLTRNSRPESEKFNVPSIGFPNLFTSHSWKPGGRKRKAFKVNDPSEGDDNGSEDIIKFPSYRDVTANQYNKEKLFLYGFPLVYGRRRRNQPTASRYWSNNKNKDFYLNQMFSNPYKFYTKALATQALLLRLRANRLTNSRNGMPN